ncbi:DMT family transporter [Chromobacterium haemolyticum]|uniref:DMT family transporter n=1 Tax=Chromobacterium haemolyticum TaxID=394935 RepID=UPI00193B38F7
MNSIHRQQYLRRRTRWGYGWALCAAVLWGAWYVPGAAVWHEAPLAGLAQGRPEPFLMAAAVLTAFHACLVAAFQLLWLAALGKLADFFRTLWRFGGISKWYFLAAVLGGLMANFGSYLAMGYVGAVFAAVAGLLYPVVGAALARLWYHERIGRRAALGIAVIVLGGAAIYAPGLSGDLAGEGAARWLGYLGGALAALGWGLEGAIVGRAMDVTDPDCGVAIRYLAEALYWVLLILPALAWLTPLPVYSLAGELWSWRPMLYLAVGGLSFAFCAVAWYKSFPLIGVGRGQAIGAFYALFATLFTAAFTLNFPEWHFLIGLALVILGGFVMVSDSERHPGTVRNVEEGA